VPPNRHGPWHHQRLLPALPSHLRTDLDAHILECVTCGILLHFLDPQPTLAPTSTPQVNGGGGDGGWAAVKYIELCTMPRAMPHMSRRVYLKMVLDEIEAHAPDAVALIISLNHQMTPEVAQEVLELAVLLHWEGQHVVGVNLCGDPKVCSINHLMYFLPACVAPHCRKLWSWGLGNRCQVD